MDIPASKILFLQGISFDVIVTSLGVTYNAGTEGNYFLTMIQPNELMLAVFLVSNLLMMGLCWDLPDMMGGKFGTRGHSFSGFLLSSHGLFRILCGFTWMGLHLM